MNTSSIIHAGMLAVFVAAKTLAQDDPAAEAEKKRLERTQALIEESIGWYDLFPARDAPTALQPQTALRWLNAARGLKEENVLVLWMQDGRPVVSLSIYAYGGNMCHEFASLSRGTKLVAKDRGAVVWSPSVAGVEFQDFPDAPAPGETPAARLRQMKALTERLGARMTGFLNADDSDREELRLLPRPVYRYDLKDAASSHPGLADGAVFAYVQGTDPEVLLLLEAVGEKDRFRWQYAFSRATGGGLEARLDDKVVWSAKKLADDWSQKSNRLTLRRAIR